MKTRHARQQRARAGRERGFGRAAGEADHALCVHFDEPYGWRRWRQTRAGRGTVPSCTGMASEPQRVGERDGRHRASLEGELAPGRPSSISGHRQQGGAACGGMHIEG